MDETHLMTATWLRSSGNPLPPSRNHRRSQLRVITWTWCLTIFPIVRRLHGLYSGSDSKLGARGALRLRPGRLSDHVEVMMYERISRRQKEKDSRKYRGLA